MKWKGDQDLQKIYLHLVSREDQLFFLFIQMWLDEIEYIMSLYLGPDNISAATNGNVEVEIHYLLH